MKKVSTVAAKQSRNSSEQKLTIGLDLGDRSSYYCILDDAGRIVMESKVSTSPKAMEAGFELMPQSRIALETGTHSPWVSRLLSGLGHEVIVAHARNVRLIGESRRKDDRLDAQTLARLARIDPQLLCPVKHRSAKAQADLTVIRARAGLVRARTALVNTARGLAKSYGERLRGCNVRNMNPEKAAALSPELQAALEPLLAGIEAVSEQIREYNERIERLAEESYPQVKLLKQVKGVGTLIALTFLLTLEDAHLFRKSRDVGCYLGLQPGRRNSGQSEPQMHISKEGDPYLRTLLVQGAQHVADNPTFGIAHWGLARSYWGEHKYPLAIQEFEADAQLEGDTNRIEYAAAMDVAFHSGGWPSALRKGIEVSLAQAKTGYVRPYQIAQLYADLGDKDHAFRWLATAYQEHGNLPYGIRTDFAFDSLRSDPRYTQLVHKIGFPQ